MPTQDFQLFTPGPALEDNAARMFDILNRIAEHYAKSSENIPLMGTDHLGPKKPSIESEIWDVLADAAGEKR